MKGKKYIYIFGLRYSIKTDESYFNINSFLIDLNLSDIPFIKVSFLPPPAQDFPLLNFSVYINYYLSQWILPSVKK